MLSILTIEELSALGKHRWAVPVLALLQAQSGARFVVMLNQLGLARESLVRTLEAAIMQGWVMRNPGHGHPLRPEYILTPAGKRLAAVCESIVAAQGKIAVPQAALTRWSLPLIHLVSRGHNRFNMMERALGGANPRALTLSLKSLIGNNLLARKVVDDYPPITNYQLTRSGKIMATAITT
jgi:DNA-binding HxlR family transcriptional regulator